MPEDEAARLDSRDLRRLAAERLDERPGELPQLLGVVEETPDVRVTVDELDLDPAAHRV